MKLRELPGLTAEVTQVVHAADLDGPPDKPHVFVYFITIANASDVSVTIKGRKWVVREANGETLVVEGDGVVGEFPHLEPGEQFHYNSSHAIATDAVAEGAYLGVSDAGEAVFTRIPPFEMRVPR
ncbi:MAG: ApaG domain [Terrimicrobiaceae bacterium]|nr:ApaG domain [Terrimicrobiaceae bacterium]